MPVPHLRRASLASKLTFESFPQPTPTMPDFTLGRSSNDEPHVSGDEEVVEADQGNGMLLAESPRVV